MQLSLFNFFKPKLKKPTRTRVVPSSDPELYLIWCNTRKLFFPNRSDIDEYTVLWSKRNQKRTLASCNIDDRKVIVARELNYPQHRVWLEPLLYHEMCHAYFGTNIPRNNGKYSWHGKEFRQLEQRHPLMKEFEHWVKNDGWSRAVRSDRAKQAHKRRKQHAA